jgi:Tfp pilus assembly protein PilN
VSAPREDLVVPAQRTAPRASGAHLWDVVPGWGIAADLTPPELIARRHLRVVRRRVALGLVVLLVLCGLGYVGATLRSSDAQAALSDEQARTTALQVESRQYSDVTQVQGQISLSQQQVARLMAQDVDLGALLGALRAQLPGGMTIDQVSATVDVVKPGAAGAVQAATAAALGSGGATTVGRVTVQGSATSLDQLPTFLDHLSSIAGLVAPLPLTNASSKAGVRYSLQVAMTDALLTHRYDQGAK